MTATLFTTRELLDCEGSGLAPILMRKDEVINLKTAVHVSGKTDKTVRDLCKEFGIARQTKPGAPLEISAPAFEMVIHGDIVALNLLRDGKRDHPRVRRVFDHLGLP